MPINSRNNTAKFNPDPIRKDGALVFLRDCPSASAVTTKRRYTNLLLLLLLEEEEEEEQQQQHEKRYGISTWSKNYY